MFLVTWRGMCLSLRGGTEAFGVRRVRSEAGLGQGQRRGPA